MKGVFTALVTPFDSKGQIDEAAFRALLRDQKAARVTGVIPCGTTGESPCLTPSEKKRLIELCLIELKGTGLKVVAGTGSNNTAETIEFSRWASDAGVDGVLVVTPYYNKPSPKGLEQHFLKVAESVRCEVMLYNVPGRTGVSLTPETISALAQHPKIRSLKEATGNVAFSSEILDRLQLDGRTIDILSGDDATYFPLLTIGAVGVVSVASNLFPRAMIALQAAADTENWKEARTIHQTYFPLFRDLFIESNPSPIKAALAFTGVGSSIFPDRLREPLAPLSPSNLQRLEQSLARCGLSRGGGTQ